MKRIILYFALIILSRDAITAQSSLIANVLPQGFNISNGQVLSYNVAASQIHFFDLKIKNISTSTKTYKMKMIREIRNVVAPGDSSYPYFCFAGNCFTPNTVISPLSETLQPNQSTESVSLGGTGHAISVHYDEATVPGLSQIRYCIYETSNPSDSISFTVKYNNSTTSLKINTDLNQILSEVFPIPSADKTSLKITALHSPCNASIIVTNIAGEMISTINLLLTKGENTIDLDSQNLPNGFYCATIVTDKSQTTKKFIVSK